MARIDGLVLAVMLLLSATVSAHAEDVFEVSGTINSETHTDLPEFLAMIAKETGATFVYDRMDPQIVRRRLLLMGTVKVPRAKLFDWACAVLLTHGVVLVPANLSGGTTWNAMSSHAIQADRHPIFVPSHELERWADRDGARIVTILSANYIRDGNRVRVALAPYSTRAVGRVSDVPGTREFLEPSRRSARIYELDGPRLFAVVDYAPAVILMKKILRDLDLAAARVAREEAEEKLATARTPAECEKHLAAIARIDAFLEGRPDQSTPEATFRGLVDAARRGDFEGMIALCSPVELAKANREFRKNPDPARYPGLLALRLTAAQLAKMSYRDYALDLLRHIHEVSPEGWRRGLEFEVIRKKADGDRCIFVCRSPNTPEGEDNEIVLLREDGLWFIRSLAE